MLLTQRSLGINEPLYQGLIKKYLTGKNNLIGIEIGSYRGESAELFLKSNAFKKLYCIDPWEQGYDSTDLASSPEIVLAEQDFDQRFKDSNIVVKIKQKSSDAINLFEDNSIDFIYIDGNHQYEFVKWDIEHYYNKVKPGGIISGHDYAENSPWGVKRAVDEFFKRVPLDLYREGSWVYIKES